MQTLDKPAERRLLRSVRTAINLVSEGTEPAQAIAKVAEAEQYNPEFTKRMVELYNISRTLAHYKAAGVDGRAEDFPIADPVAVMTELTKTHIGEEKAAVANQMRDFASLRPPRVKFAKAASYQRDPRILVRKALDRQATLDKAAAMLKTAYLEMRDKFHNEVTAIVNYFREPTHEPFLHVEKRALAAYPQHGKPLMDLVWNLMGGLCKHEKRAEAPDGLLDATKGIGKRIDNALKFAECAAALKDRHAQAVKAAEEFKKQAAGAISTIGRSVIAPAISGTVMGNILEPSKTNDVPNVFYKFFSPEHIAKLKAIRAKAMLHELMNLDPVVSKYDPADVLDAFNSVSQLAPSAIDKPALMRSYVRRLLEGGQTLEPFEIKQLAETERQVNPNDIDTALSLSKGR